MSEPLPIPPVEPTDGAEINHGKRGLLVIGCSERKRRSSAPAIELYDGPWWQDMRAHRESRLLRAIGVFVLSAHHGLIEARETALATYDRRLPTRPALEDLARAPASLGCWRAMLMARRPVFLVMGRPYRHLLDLMTLAAWPEGQPRPEGLAEPACAAGGIGQKRAELRAWLRRAQGIEA